MIVARTRHDVASARARCAGRVGVVPTMGALHAGHATLLDAAAARADHVIATIFVNPLQFGAGEDLDRYPRTLDDDLALCERHGVGVVFAPDAATIYPGGVPEITVDPGPRGDILEGESRPGHFRGVLTVVAKLFGLTSADLAFFGEKDHQQLVLVTAMSAALDLGVEVVGVPTRRDADGLALSSRNRYLSADQRRSALALSRALRAGQEAGAGGAAAVEDAARAVLDAEPGAAVEYVAVRGVELGPAPAAGPSRLLIAAQVGGTRLIDNAAVGLGG